MTTIVSLFQEVWMLIFNSEKLDTTFCVFFLFNNINSKFFDWIYRNNIWEICSYFKFKHCYNFKYLVLVQKNIPLENFLLGYQFEWKIQLSRNVSLNWYIQNIQADFSSYWKLIFFFEKKFIQIYYYFCSMSWSNFHLTPN